MLHKNNFAIHVDLFAERRNINRILVGKTLGKLP
jgi:hypothetical protein